METFSSEESPCTNKGTRSILRRGVLKHLTEMPCLSKLTRLHELDIGWGAEKLNKMRKLSKHTRLRVLFIAEIPNKKPNPFKFLRLNTNRKILERALNAGWHRTISKNVDEVIRDHGFREEALEVADKVGQGHSSKASWAAYAEFVFQKSRRVLYVDIYHKGSPSKEDATQPGNSRRLKERSEFFANLRSVEELKDFICNMKRVLHFVLGSTSTSIEFLNFSVSEEFHSSLLDAMKSRNWEEVESMVMPIAAALPQRAAIYEAFIFLASLLLSVVFQYLISLVEKGGTKTHSSGSLEFGSRYIAIVLFQGAYVWIKFREVAPRSQQKPLSGLYRKCIVNNLGVKEYCGNFEPRFKPSGFANYISVGSYDVEGDAKTIYQILEFLFGRPVSSELPLPNGSTYHIPHMTQDERGLDPEAKKEWAKAKAKAILEEYKREVFSSSFLWDPQAGQATEDISNTLPPDAGAGCGGQSVQLDNQNDGFVPPNVDPGMQDHVADDTWNDHAAGGLEFGDEAPRGPQFQRHDLEENQVNNMNPDALDILRLVKKLQRLQELDQFRIQQLESHQQLDQFRIQQLESQIQQQGSQILQQETRISGLVRDQQLHEFHMQQQVSRISEMEGEVERLRSTKPARKRICVGLSLRHDSQN